MPKHREFKPAQKSRAALQVLTGERSAAHICRDLQIHPNLFSRWKKQFLEQASLVFEKESPVTHNDARVAELERLVGHLTLELDAAKKASQFLNSHPNRNGRS
jgi:transposase-like protein